MSKILTKAEFAKALGVSRPTVSSYCRRGMPQEPDGCLDEGKCRAWIKANVRAQTGMRGLGGRVLADDDDNDADVDSKEHSAARLLKARADRAELELERMRGGTEEERRLKLIETTIAHLWWVFQRHSPHATTGLFIGNGWLNAKDGGSCARASSLIAARDCTIMRQLAGVIEAAFSDGLEPVDGRRDAMLPWSREQIEWAKEVGDVFQAEIDDLPTKSESSPRAANEVFHVDADGEVRTTTKKEA
ncbi:MAG TPA: hypothetical protein VH558_04195 [Pseudolabrys sp.]|jgi:transcriptional regulator with XRE-family HTH domain